MKDILRLSNFLDPEMEYIPFSSDMEEALPDLEKLNSDIPILPLRDNVLFPGVLHPVTIGREKTMKLVKEAHEQNKYIGVVAQRNKEQDNPGEKDLYNVGTLARILKIFPMPDSSVTILIQGIQPFSIQQIVQEEPYLTARVNPIPSAKMPEQDDNFKALFSSLTDIASEIFRSSKQQFGNEGDLIFRTADNPRFFINLVSSILSFDTTKKQRILETEDFIEKATYLLEVLTEESKLLEIKTQIQEKVNSDINKQQRDFFLNQQLKTIQEELGGEPGEADIKELEERAKTKKWSAETADYFNKELQKLRRVNYHSPDYSTQFNYLETFIELPWGQYTEDNFNIKHAQSVLNEDHFGLEKVKERILEHLAVLKLKGDLKAPILCLAGPPGVGKTSLGKSIATALGRKYVRISLGGLRDESEIRGHRRTYIGAMPGRIIQNLKKAESANPVFVLDEIDKVLGMNVSGDPSAALLEVLDPEQNTAFHDNYLNYDFDLSKVLFIATANNLNTIPPALLDRMEVIEVPGYILEEKTAIAEKHLIPKQLKEHGMIEKQLCFPKEITIQLIQNYTRESGVRQLEKQIAKVVRSRARMIADNEGYNKKLTSKDLINVLGAPIFDSSSQLKENMIGVATGLAWTPVGGEILFIETSLSQGKGMLTLTGNLGEVMKESATLAFEYLKAHADVLKIKKEAFETQNIHIHVPAGATPKDGPSAGIAMFAALASAYTKRPIKASVAMSGEITLRGKVLPVGGIREKILAAKRANITDIVLCKENKRQIDEIPSEYIEGLKFHYIDKMIEIIKLAM